MTTLETNNIKLRAFRLADKERMAELANNKKVSINLRDAFPHPYTLRDAETFIAKCIAQNPTTTFAIEYNDDYVGNNHSDKKRIIFNDEDGDGIEDRPVIASCCREVILSWVGVD